MLVKVAVRSFQSLRSVTLDLGRITVIVGHSDSGKSAFLRAVEAAAFNESVFDDVTFIPGIGASEKISVAFQFEDGRAVVWEKTKTSAKYHLVKGPGVKPEVFTKMGRSFVPEEIQKVLGIREVAIDTSVYQRIQFGGQHDPPFLVGDRGGVFASRVLGRLTGVHVLSNAARQCQADKSQQSSQLEAESQTIDRLTIELKQYEGEEQRREQLTASAKKLTLIKERQNRLRELSRLRDQLDAVQTARSKVAFDQSSLDQIAAVEQGLRTLWVSMGRIQQINNVLTQLRTVSTRLEQAQRIHSDMVAKDLPLPDIDHLSKLLELRKRWTSVRGSLGTVLGAERELGTKLTAIEGELAIMDKTFPLCPFVDKFPQQQGLFRCTALMKVIAKNG